MTIEEKAQRHLAERYLELEEQRKKGVRSANYLLCVFIAIFVPIAIAGVWAAFQGK